MYVIPSVSIIESKIQLPLFAAHNLTFFSQFPLVIRLETGLRTYQHLTLNQRFIVKHNGESFEFAVLELKPSEAVAITDSDLVVDVVEPADQTRYEPTPLQEPNTAFKLDSPNSFVFYKCTVIFQQMWLAKWPINHRFFRFAVEITDPNANKAIQITAQGSCNVAIAHNTRFPTIKNCQWSAMGATRSTIPLNNQDPNFATGLYYIGIYSLTPSLQGTISIETGAWGVYGFLLCFSCSFLALQSLATLYKAHRQRRVLALEFNPRTLCNAATGAQIRPLPSTDWVHLTLPLHLSAKFIPTGTFSLHEAQCRKRNYRCELCGTVVPIEERANHHAQQHSSVTCTLCSEWSGSPDLLGLHKEFECKNRPFPCPYCQLDVPFSTRATHMKDCGTRTQKCEICGENVRNYDKHNHMASKHPNSCAQPN